MTTGRGPVLARLLAGLGVAAGLAGGTSAQAGWREVYDDGYAARGWYADPSDGDEVPVYRTAPDDRQGTVYRVVPGYRVAPAWRYGDEGASYQAWPRSVWRRSMWPDDRDGVVSADPGERLAPRRPSRAAAAVRSPSTGMDGQADVTGQDEQGAPATRPARRRPQPVRLPVARPALAPGLQHQATAGPVPAKPAGGLPPGATRRVVPPVAPGQAAPVPAATRTAAVTPAPVRPVLPAPVPSAQPVAAVPAAVPAGIPVTPVAVPVPRPNLEGLDFAPPHIVETALLLQMKWYKTIRSYQ